MANDLVLKTAHNQLEKLLSSKAGLCRRFNQTRFYKMYDSITGHKRIEKVQPITMQELCLKLHF